MPSCCSQCHEWSPNMILGGNLRIATLRCALPVSSIHKWRMHLPLMITSVWPNVVHISDEVTGLIDTTVIFTLLRSSNCISKLTCLCIFWYHSPRWCSSHGRTIYRSRTSTRTQDRGSFTPSTGWKFLQLELVALDVRYYTKQLGEHPPIRSCWITV